MAGVRPRIAVVAAAALVAAGVVAVTHAASAAAVTVQAYWSSESRTAGFEP
jgi:hypothetical protein